MTTYIEQIQTVHTDPQALERLYRQAVSQMQETDFIQAMQLCFEQMPDDALLAAWHYRFALGAAAEIAHSAEESGDRVRHWTLAIALSLLCGGILWLFSDLNHLLLREHLPALLLVWAPISAGFVIAYLWLTTRSGWRPALVAGVPVLASLGYVIAGSGWLATESYTQHYLDLTALHLPVLAWAATGLYLLWGRSDRQNRFAFLIKSLEIFITGGLFVMAGALFTGITFGLFQAIGIEPGELMVRLFLAGGGGLIPVLAVAVAYDPHAGPAAQSFRSGLSGLIAILMRLLLPLTLLVLVIYIGFIPFNFLEPFRNRDLLIVYNGMLFALIGLLVGATPITVEMLAPGQRLWLRRGVIAVAILAGVVTVYATAALLYRTVGGFTPNRTAFLGWNGINLALLTHLLLGQRRANATSWVAALQQTFSWGMNLYAVWALALVLVLPWLF